MRRKVAIRNKIVLGLFGFPFKHDGIIVVIFVVFVVHGFTFSRVTESIRRDIRTQPNTSSIPNQRFRTSRQNGQKRPTNRQINKLQNEHIDNSEILTTVNQLKNQPHD